MASLEKRIAIETGIKAGEPPVSLQERMDQLHVPGVSIAVINKGEIEWAKGYGELADETTQIQAASISKTVTALRRSHHSAKDCDQINRPEI